MTTEWINDINGISYKDYDEARESVLQYMDYTDDMKETLRQYTKLHGINHILRGLTDSTIGQQIHDELLEMATEQFLSDYLVEIEVEEEDEENE